MPDYTGSQALNALTAPDSYTPLSTLEGAVYQRFLIDVTGQSIYWQLKLQSGGGTSGNWEGTEKYMIPGSRVISRSGVVGIRVRAAIPFASLPSGQPRAVVTVEGVT